MKIKSDEELMTLIQNGKKRAFEELYNRFSEKILFFFYSKLDRDIEKSNDFLHDLFMKVIENPHAFDTNRKFSTWIYNLANNMCKNEYIRNSVWVEKVEARILESIQLEGNKEARDEEKIKSFNEKLASELEKLKETHSTVFLLKYKENFTIKEISEILNCSEGTIKSRLFYTVKKLSVALEDYNPN